MDKPLAIHEKKTTKPKHRQNPQKSKKKQQQEATNAPVKVVYIANPVNFSTSASEFRSLVQQLTGKHAYSASDKSVGGSQNHQQSVVDASIELKLPEIIDAVADDHEAEEIASSSSLNCRTITSDHNSNLLDIGGHRAVTNHDDAYNIPDPMLDNYIWPLDFWYDQY